jgi:hypothetical protein
MELRRFQAKPEDFGHPITAETFDEFFTVSIPPFSSINFHKYRFENRFGCEQQKVCNIAQSAALRFLIIFAQEIRGNNKLEASHAH